MGVNSKDKRDFYYFKAKKLSYRARSAFKLIDINNEYNIFEGVNNVLDLCAAPGSWSQVLNEELNKDLYKDNLNNNLFKDNLNNKLYKDNLNKDNSNNNSNKNIIAVDIQDIDPIENVNIIKSDITSDECIQKILLITLGEKVDLIVCDGAPDVTGFHDLDQYLQMDLLKSALNISCKILKEEGTLVAKCFRGEYTFFIVNLFRKYFDSVILTKPRSSRSNSIECFILGKGFKNNMDFMNNLDFINNIDQNIQCFECGNGKNPDFTIEYVFEENQRKAVNPPYKEAIEKRRNNFNK